MRTTTEETKNITVTTTKIFCDICGVDVDRYTHSICDKCGRDICRNCVGNIEEIGDSRYDICVECWNKGEKYRSRIKELEDEIDSENEKWENECKNQ